MSLPKRLVDDESAAPWLAERLRGVETPSPMTSETRARIGAAIAARANERTTVRVWSPWLVTAGMAAAVAFALAPQLASLHREHDAVPRAPLRPEPLTHTAGAVSPEPRTPVSAPEAAASAPAEPSAARARPSPEPRAGSRARHRNKTPAHQAHGSTRERERATDRTPAWLIEARAALATDPERTLELIRVNRDRDVAVSPELLDLAARAVEARHSIRAAVPADASLTP